MLDKICTLMAKSAPYPPCTVTALWLKFLPDSTRMLRRVTQPPHIAGPLGGIVANTAQLSLALGNNQIDL